MLNVFITGASTGIGAALARQYASRGAVGTTVVIANAGMSHGVKTEYLEDLDMLEDIYRLNVFAMAYTFHAFIGPMKARGNGQLVGIGSVAGIRGLPGSEANLLSLHIAKAFGLKCRNTAFAYQPSARVSSALRSLPRILIRCRSLWNPMILRVKPLKPLQLAPAIV